MLCLFFRKKNKTCYLTFAQKPGRYGTLLGQFVQSCICAISVGLFFFVVAHDSIVLDLTMQCIFCPWLCQAPWSLVCTVCLSYLDIYFNVSAFFQIFMYK